MSRPSTSTSSTDTPSTSPPSDGNTEAPRPSDLDFRSLNGGTEHASHDQSRPEDRQKTTCENAFQAPRDANREGQHSNAHEKEVRSLDPAPLTYLHFAARGICRVVTGPKRALDEQDGSEHHSRQNPNKQQN